MLKATSVDTTPSARHRRRGAAPASADAGLIRAAAEIERVAAAAAGLRATPRATDKRIDRVNDRFFAIVDLATETRAATEDGILAKAMILRREIAEFGEPDESAATTLALSICDDLIRLRAPAGS
jgi:hypothetical protein